MPVVGYQITVCGTFQAYYPGQSISGSVQLTLSESKSYKYISVTLKGKGKVEWTEEVTRTIQEGDETKYIKETVEYDEKEKYADESVVVWGNKDAHHESSIGPGTLDFPFQLTVPPHCLPTFETDSGKIKYKLAAVASREGEDDKAKTPLIMGSLIDLNAQPDLALPVEKSTVKEITTCCCFSAGETEINFKMPRTGFCVVKDHIPVTVECKNGSSKVITVRVELAQKIAYSADGKHKSDNKIISNFTLEVQPSETDTKSSELALPSTVVLGFSSKIIKVAHCVRLWLDHSWNLSGVFSEPPVSVPVVIGNVVLNEAAPQEPGAPADGAAAYPPVAQSSGDTGYPPQAVGPPEQGLYPPIPN